ncbi:manganese efflux pump MntP [Parvibacter caecicola]|uniref:Putative manganese efflux pump MntP n=1 Tax=Parvibacter caecicola TaxID=747645 RepID=A0A7W5D117_9ACTN|nr:manganese efflux pump MntP family protein [Parvibacter caecicola]MBB3170526.1 putative Mn2+ efflux pump MntP [Parvibacter caecicola]MCR2041512.1 manganese efflux pump MntP family protein [Parvibacter caecicola]
MGIAAIFLTGVGLSMDAFAVAVCKGLGMSRVNWGRALVIALFFGAFQAFMPVAGWALGSQFAAIVTPVDHWIAFGLLAFIGGKMLWDAFHEEGCSEGECSAVKDAPLQLGQLLMLAVATSIDALAVGITFAFLQVNIALAAAVIGLTAFCLSFAGVVIGNYFGAKFQKGATVAGGAVLILIGAKILCEHLLQG